MQRISDALDCPCQNNFKTPLYQVSIYSSLFKDSSPKFRVVAFHILATLRRSIKLKYPMHIPQSLTSGPWFFNYLLNDQQINSHRPPRT